MNKETVRSSISSAIRPSISRSIIPPVPSGRWYQRFNGASYVEVPTATFGGQDFTVSMSVDITDTPTGVMTLIGGELGSADAIVIDCSSSSGIRALAFVGSTLQTIVAINSVPVTDVETIELSFDYSLSLITLTVNNVSITETWQLDGNQNIARLASRVDWNRSLAGVMYNVKITGATSVGGDTSINSLEYKLDEPWSDDHIAYDSANEFPELVTSGDANWTTHGGANVVDDVIYLQRAQGEQEAIAWNIGTANAGEELFVSFDLSAQALGNVSIRIDWSVTWLNPTTDGYQTYRITPAASGVIGISGGGSTYDMIVDRLSVSRNKHGKKINDVEADYYE